MWQVPKLQISLFNAFFMFYVLGQKWKLLTYKITLESGFDLEIYYFRYFNLNLKTNEKDFPFEMCTSITQTFQIHSKRKYDKSFSALTCKTFLKKTTTIIILKLDKQTTT